MLGGGVRAPPVIPDPQTKPNTQHRTPTHTPNTPSNHTPHPIKNKQTNKNKQTQPDKAHLAEIGLDLVEGRARNNVEAGVLEPALSKTKMVQFATEAAITILRIDDLIRLEPPQDAGDDDDH